MRKHRIRIVGGDYRRTPIPVVDGAHLRPSPDRVRETLFNWLTHFWGGDFSDKRVLDLFAGTGALGFEAASRGAAHVQFVEQAPAALAALHALQRKLQASHVHIQAGDAQTALRKPTNPKYDLLMLDPPFGQGWFERLWPLVPNALAHNGLVYLEAELKIEQFPADFTLLRQGQAGQVCFYLLQFAAMQKTVNNPEINCTPIHP